MNKRDRLARFLTCLLPCSLILTALPVQAQDPVESSTEPAPAHSDFATPEAAPSQPAVKSVAFQEADASVPAEKPVRQPQPHPVNRRAALILSIRDCTCQHRPILLFRTKPSGSI